MSLTLPGWSPGHYTAEELARGSRSEVSAGATLAAGGLYPSAFVRVSVEGDFRLYLASDTATAVDRFLTFGEHRIHAVKATTTADGALTDGDLAFCYVR
jgi:hypothetical protein